MTMHRTFLFIATLILSTILTPSFAQNKTDRSTLLSEIETDLKENILSFWAENSVDPQTKHLVLFCDDEWNPLEEVHSYGHDIETSWLLSEAARATEDAELIEYIKRYNEQQKPKVLELLEKCSDKNIVILRSREQADALLNGEKL